MKFLSLVFIPWWIQRMVGFWLWFKQGLGEASTVGMQGPSLLSLYPKQLSMMRSIICEIYFSLLLYFLPFVVFVMPMISFFFSSEKYFISFLCILLIFQMLVIHSFWVFCALGILINGSIFYIWIQFSFLHQFKFFISARKYVQL